MTKNRWKWIGTLICCVIVLAIAAPQLYGADGDIPPGIQRAPVLPPPQGDGTTLVRVYYGEDRALYSGVLKSFDVLETDYERGYHVVQVTPEELERLEKAGLRLEAETVRTLEQYFTPRTALGGMIETIPSYPCYRTVEETFATAQAIATNYPTLATWTDQGDSWEKTVALGGYDMMVLKLTNSAIPGPKPKLFVTAAIHAREYATAELITRFAEYLVDNYGTDADATWLIDHHEMHLMLQTNPDGRKKAETGLSWRKNTNQNYCGATSNLRGADLNRNFEFSWGCCGGSSTNPCDLTYRGPSAASEPETQAVQNYVRANFPDQRGPNPSDPAPNDATGIYLDIHSYGQLLLWPWGHTPDPSPNGTQLQTMGRKLAYWNGHSPEQAYGLYPTDGTTDGVGYGELGVASFTYELGTAFFQSCSYFEGTLLPGNMPSLIYAAKVARTPYMTPAGPEALSLSLSGGATAPGVLPGTPVTLQATINDTRYNNSNGTEPTQAIAAAEYYIDTPPWGTGATAVAMSASDGTFNSSVEGVQGTIDTTGLSAGQHIVFVRGQDAAGNWGAFSAVFLYVSPSAPTVSIFNPIASSTVAGTVAVLIDATDAEDPAGSLDVEWNVDGGAWQPAPYNGGTGKYEASWDTTAASEGPHTVNAQATDSGSNVGSDSVNVTVDNVNDPPVASFTYDCTGLDCAFDGSASYDPDGTIVSYDWDFGDGTQHGSGATPEHSYATADTYIVVLTVTDDDTATDDETQNVTVQEGGPMLYLGSSTSGTAGGVAFADEDILAKDLTTGAWALYIDGSDVGLGGTDIDAFEIQGDGSLLMSFDTAFTLSGFGAVDDSDILRFVPTSTGDTTAGTWQWYFDGSDVGLSTNDEDVDAFALLPDGRLLISTLGNVSVTGASGADEDLLAFTPTQLGATTSGTWAMYFDGSDVGLSTSSSEDVNGAWVDAAGKIYLTTLGAFSVTGVSGDGSDIFVCTPGSLGSTTTCTWAMYWDGSANGFSGEVTDSFAIEQ